jgi:chemotaxis protein MotB
MAKRVKKCPPPGLPAWMATFSDLMALLMCFFVLLLSFAEIDVKKFKQLQGSMKEAFGVQDKIKLEEIPKGTSIIAQEFSPGRPDPTVFNEVRQKTIDSDLNTLDIRSVEADSTTLDKVQGVLEKFQELEEQAQKDAVQFAKVLQKEMKNGSIDVETEGSKIIIRIKEKGSFEGGSARLNPGYIPIVAKIRDVLLNIKGRVSIEGHTDNVAYTGYEFESNWSLSSERALAVAHELFADIRMSQARFQVIGFAAYKPKFSNATKESRSKNRRVEIVIHKGDDEDLLKPIQARPLTPKRLVELAKEAQESN